MLNSKFCIINNSDTYFYWNITHEEYGIEYSLENISSIAPKSVCYICAYAEPDYKTEYNSYYAVFNFNKLWLDENTLKPNAKYTIWTRSTIQPIDTIDLEETINPALCPQEVGILTMPDKIYYLRIND